MRLASLLFSCLVFLAAPALADSAPAKPIAIETLLEPAGMLAASLSPDGKHLALIGYTGFNYSLLLADTSDMKTTILVKGYEEADGYYVYKKFPHRASWITESPRVL